jgi:ParB family chromosome partitioning protein
MTMGEEGVRKALGRGLAALIGDAGNEASVLERARSQRRVPIEFLRPNPRNPRKSFADDDLADLTASIREKGIVQPILVRRVPDAMDAYEIIAGERRWRAAQRAGLHEVPVLIHDVGDKEALELAIVENVQRTDLNPLEEALGYQQLIAEFGYSQVALADVIGKSRPHVANTLRLLKLPQSVLDFIRDGRLSAGHARALVNADDPEAAARRVVDEGMNVRETEALATKPERRKRANGKASKDADALALEKMLSDLLGLAVKIAHKKNGSGEVRVRYANLEQLDMITRRLQAP